MHDFKELPKVELHLHLDSSLSYETVQQIEPGITKKEFNDRFIAPPKCHNLPDYLTRVANQVDLLQTIHSLKLATESLIRQLKRDNVIYAEIRFAPLLHTRKGLTGREVLHVVSEVLQTNSKDSDLNIGIIVCCLRSFSEEQSMQTAQLAHEFKNRNVVGIDLAGDEKGFSLNKHRKAFQFAREHNIPRTAHAGEACGPESIWETLELLEPTRIGHGVRSTEDKELLIYLKENDIHLEICPTSNIQTDVYAAYSNHTVSRLFEEEISLSINTDGRTTSNVNLSDEYEKLHDIFGWTKERFVKCNLNALESAFISKSKGSKLKRLLTEVYK